LRIQNPTQLVRALRAVLYSKPILGKARVGERVAQGAKCIAHGEEVVLVGEADLSVWNRRPDAVRVVDDLAIPGTRDIKRVE
jgi:hypothetical protein